MKMNKDIEITGFPKMDSENMVKDIISCVISKTGLSARQIKGIGEDFDNAENMTSMRERQK